MKAIFSTLQSSIRDLLPIVLVIAFFQVVVLQQALPNVLDILLGTLFAVIGLSLFIRGLEMGLFPIGESMARAFAKKGSVAWLLIFSFCLGFGTTVAEPALIAVAAEAANVAAEAGAITNSTEARASYSNGLRMTFALSVGFAIVIGVLRILRNWPIQYLIIGAIFWSSRLPQSPLKKSSVLPTTAAASQRRPSRCLWSQL
ncbi:MAG: hypothetical protein ACI93R_000856 [Flavobacteriales bacterium]|jgi:hypothetical protein